ncbi:MAG: saccharopine dehydrogenase NADP-binding domain-containing protein [Pseudomonadota bacterium]
MRSILILGGYGNFGKRIAQALVKAGASIIVAGRNKSKADAMRRQLDSRLVSVATFDAFTELGAELKKSRPSVVINTCGPFQTSDYGIAQCCIEHGVHYIDLADARAFVTDIGSLDDKARQQGVAVISGASTVPALSSAVLEHFRHEFSVIHEMKFGISPGQKAERGLATTEGILGYVGRPIQPYQGQKNKAYGWQDIYRQKYPVIGSRWMANCEIPDLDLLPQRYDLKSIRFGAGLELSVLHLGLWGLSWLVRAGFPLSLSRFAKPLLTVSNWFDPFGSADGGMHVIITGEKHDGSAHARKWFIVAFEGFGPHIPTIPAIILAKRIVQNSEELTGAMPCVGLISLEDYLAELRGFPIETYVASHNIDAN